MNIRLEASAGTLELITALKTAPARLRQVQLKQAFILGQTLVKRAQDTYRNAPQTTRTATKVRTGALRRSYTASEPTDTGRGVTFDFGVLQAGAEGKVLEYAGVQEFGATIRAKGGGYLAIPIGPWTNTPQNAAARGMSAMTGVGALRAGPRDMLGLFRRGSVLFQRTGDSIMPMFVLKKEVTIPPRPALLTSVQDVLPAWVDQFTAALDAASTGAV